MCRPASFKSRKRRALCPSQFGLTFVRTTFELQSAALCYGLRPMRRSLHSRIATGRVLAGYTCLLAVILLWAPLWAAAWQAQGMACCNGAMCSAHQHSRSRDSKANQSSAQTPTDCDHGGHARLTPCTLSCCQNQDHALLASVIFVLPQLAQVSLPPDTLAPVSQVTPSHYSRFFDPLFPPPRISSPH